MSVSPAPIFLLGGLALLARSKSGAGSAPDAQGVLDNFCEELAGIWHEPKGDNLPLTFAGYGKAYDVIDAKLEEGGAPDRDEVIMTTLHKLSAVCPWGIQASYSQRMKDVAGAMGVVYENVVSDRSGGGS